MLAQAMNLSIMYGVDIILQPWLFVKSADKRSKSLTYLAKDSILGEKTKLSL